mmetsp:Transcript_37627/g.73700  ORF Transcript_37627/g.73700 Transcript_37627/m.73700 type:complete len:171 (-) Transcript_37627:87-599(-)
MNSLSIAARRSARIISVLRPCSATYRCLPRVKAPVTSGRWFADDTGTHDDFAPKRKVVSDQASETAAMIEEHITGNHVMLYMKGKPSQPMCGFSAKVCEVLKREAVDFGSVNVLDYPAIREGVKAYSQWPTIPQLYVNGEFLGGCDIIIQMHESGELAEVLKEVPGHGAD